MNFNVNKSEVTTVTLSIELIMYGNVMARLDQEGEKVRVQYTAIADGGEVCGEKVESFAGKKLDTFVETFNSLTFSDEEDEEASKGWSIQIGDKDANVLAEVEFGYWNADPIFKLVNCIKESIADCKAVDALNDILMV